MSDAVTHLTTEGGLVANVELNELGRRALEIPNFDWDHALESAGDKEASEDEFDEARQLLFDFYMENISGVEKNAIDLGKDQDASRKTDFVRNSYVMYENYASVVGEQDNYFAAITPHVKSIKQLIELVRDIHLEIIEKDISEEARQATLKKAVYEYHDKFDKFESLLAK
jgi:hypothetical protein